jgi:hypothetical protein
MDAEKIRRQNSVLQIDYVDSSNKCNKVIIEDLVRGSEEKGLTRTVIKAVIDPLDIILGQSGKVSFFREVLTDETVSVLVGASLPGRIRVGKEEIGIELLGDPLVANELEAVI